VADFFVELGAVVVVVAAVVGVVALADVELPEESPEPVAALSCEVLDEPVPAVSDVVELTAVAAEAVAVVPGISLETMRPSTAAAPVARIATALDVRRTLVLARSRRSTSSLPGWF
jgi:hypothetical protein